MGVTFRSGGYIKHVKFGGRTIKDGEAAAIWDANGVHKQIIGPKRVWLINSTIRFLTRYKAESHQYLKVFHCNGKVEHIVGPVVLYQNPAFHDKVEVHDGYRLFSSSQCIIALTNHNNESKMKPFTYPPSTNSTCSSTDSTTKQQDDVNEVSNSTYVTKRIIFGPTLFIPQHDEYIHTFSWSASCNELQHHGSDSSMNIFNILHTNNTTTSFSITIPTNDGYSFDINLNLSFNISSIDKVLSIPDPMKALYSGLLYDSQILGRSIASSNILQDPNHSESIIMKLNTIDCNNSTPTSSSSSFPSMIRTANNYGIQINTIQITSIKPCQALDEYIQNKQALDLTIQNQITTRNHECQLHDLEIKNQFECIDDKVEMERKEMTMKHELDLERHELGMISLERKILFEKKKMEGEKEIRKLNEESILEVLEKLKVMGVDMTKFMTTYSGLAIAEELIGKSKVMKSNTDKIQCTNEVKNE